MIRVIISLSILLELAACFAALCRFYTVREYYLPRWWGRSIACYLAGEVLLIISFSRRPPIPPGSVETDLEQMFGRALVCVSVLIVLSLAFRRPRVRPGMEEDPDAKG